MYISLILLITFMVMYILYIKSYISAIQLAGYSMLFLIYHLIFGVFRKERGREKLSKHGEFADETLMNSKRLLSKNIDWLETRFTENLCYETCQEIDYVLGLYREQPTIYAPLMYKYEETFTEIESVLEVAEKEGLMLKHSLHFQLRELLTYPIKEFNDLKKIIDDNNQLRIQIELEILNQRIETEIKMIKDIRRMTNGS